VSLSFKKKRKEASNVKFSQMKGSGREMMLDMQNKVVFPKEFFDVSNCATRLSRL
jgi:hypothetical protein